MVCEDDCCCGWLKESPLRKQSGRYAAVATEAPACVCECDSFGEYRIDDVVAANAAADAVTFGSADLARVIDAPDAICAAADDDAAADADNIVAADTDADGCDALNDGGK